MFRAAARVIHELALTPAQFAVELIGDAANYGGTRVEDMASQEGLAGFVRIGPPRSRADAMSFLAEASVLVSLPQDSTLSIPSKLFEYLRFPAWTLAMAEAGSATAQLLAGTGAAVVAPHDLEAMVRFLRERYLEFAAGHHPSPLSLDPALSRRAQAARLLAALESLGA